MTCSLTAPTALVPLALLFSLGCGTSSSSGEGSTATDGSTTTGEPDQWDDMLEPVAGSRLRPVFRIAEDGTRVQFGWHDTLFDTPCDFGQTPSDGLRCLPSARGDEVWLYADANCTEPVLQDIWIPEGATVVRARGDGCFDYDYYEVGEAVTEIYYAANGPCEFFSNDPSHRVITIPHDQFVSATVTPQAGTSRIVPLLLEADDGSQQIVGAWDLVHEEEVAPAPDATGQLRWFGRREPSVSTYYYADAGCTERVAVAACVPDSEQPKTAKETEPAPCSALLGRHALLEELGSLHVLGSDGSCTPGSLPSGSNTHAWRVGAPLDDAAFAASSAVDNGGGRLRHDVYASPEGEPFLASRRFYDLLLAEAECAWRDPSPYTGEPSTGTLDCIPNDAASLINRYEDSDCTQQRASRFVLEDSCPPPAQYAYAASVVAALAGPAAGPGDYTLDDQDDCVPAEPEGETDGDYGGEREHYLVDGAPTVEAAHAADVVE